MGWIPSRFHKPEPDEIQRKALELSGADYVIPDFYTELYNHLKIYLKGLL